MRRKLLHFIAGVSLLLCVGTAALWVRSYWHVDHLGYENAETADLWQRGGNVSSLAGTLNLDWWLRQSEPTSSRRERSWGFSSRIVRGGVPRRARDGFHFEATSWDSSRPSSDGRPVPARMTHLHSLTVPHWFLLLLTLLPIAIWVLSMKRQRRRLQRGLCRACGYDLRATPDRCPECGAIPEPFVG